MAGVHDAGQRLGGAAISREVLSEAASGFLLDLDGTLYTEAGAIPGAVSAIQELRRRGAPFRLITNTTRLSRRSLVERLRSYGFDVRPEEVLSAVSTAVVLLEGAGVRTIAPFVAADAIEDLDRFTLSGGVTASVRGAAPEVVLIGDLGNRWTHALLDEAFRHVMDGARLVALQRGRYWLGPEGLTLDAGAYVAALEYATGTEAMVCGKPNPEFFKAAVASFGGLDVAAPLDPPIVMIGDDLWNDIEGAQRVGLEGWLVKTGKFRADALESSGIRPDRVLDSVAALSAPGV